MVLVGEYLRTLYCTCSLWSSPLIRILILYSVSVSHCETETLEWLLVDVLSGPLCILTLYLKIAQILLHSIRLVELIIVVPGHKAETQTGSRWPSANIRIYDSCRGYRVPRKHCGITRTIWELFSRRELQNVFLNESLAQKGAKRADWLFQHN